MFAAKVRVEVRVRDPAAIAFAPLVPRVLPIRHLSLGSSLLVPVFLPLLLLSHVLLPFWLLHLTFVLLAFRMPIPALRLLRRPPFVLRSRLAPIPALRFLISSVVRPSLLRRSSLFLPILRLRVVLTFIFVLILCDSH